VFATARSVGSLTDLEGLGIETLNLEVNDAKSVKKCRDDVSKLTGGKLDYLVNNAGKSMSPSILLVFGTIKQRLLLKSCTGEIIIGCCRILKDSVTNTPAI
jgi:1-acylglycerone phosphate reductase